MPFVKKSTALSVITLTALSFAPAYAGQRGQGGPPPQAHGNSVNKPAASPKSGNFADRIASHPQLVSRLQALLPPNTTLKDAAAGLGVRLPVGNDPEVFDEARVRRARNRSSTSMAA